MTTSDRTGARMPSSTCTVHRAVVGSITPAWPNRVTARRQVSIEGLLVQATPLFRWESTKLPSLQRLVRDPVRQFLAQACPADEAGPEGPIRRAFAANPAFRWCSLSEEC